MANGYEPKKTIWKGIRAALAFGLPLLLAWIVDFHPGISALTVGSIIEMVINWAKHKDD